MKPVGPEQTQDTPGHDYIPLCVGNLKKSKQMKIQAILYSSNLPVEILIDGKIIKEIKPLDNPPRGLPVVCPGFIDVQVNGYAGVSFTDHDLSVEGIKKAAEGLWEEGVTTFLPTIITADGATIRSNLKILSKSLENDKLSGSIPGFFLEGPYISPVDGFRGAHNAEFVRLPDWDEFRSFIEASGDKIIKTTIAPELEGSMNFIDKCRKAGIVVAIGHHNGSAEQIHEAAQRGAWISTHLGNGCANMIHRHNNPLWAQMADDRLTPTIIADGFHLNPDELSVFYKVKGAHNLLLISDITKLAGLPPGAYDWNGKKVLLTPEGKLRLPDLDVLAGASFSIRRGIGNMMKYTGCSLEEAIQMASSNQARIFGWHDRGSIEAGKRADLVLFDIENREVIVRQTILGGEVVFIK
ncbi:MAG: N-acetylglucosamine-6-phosphate deacetylase [Cytophagales bacterium]|nr:N-acetylglucosamine-6-phosphate deacetylase [Cytophagales bacterium]